MIANAKESSPPPRCRYARSALLALAMIRRCHNEDQMGALKQLVDEGVAKAVGISRIDNADIETACNILGDRLVAVQNQFSPVHRDPGTRWKPAKARFGFVSDVAALADSSTRSTSICSTGSAKSPRFTTAPTSASRSRGNLRNTNICSRFPHGRNPQEVRTRSKPAN